MNAFTTAWKAGSGWTGARCRNCRATPGSCSCATASITDFDQIIGPVDINFVRTPDNFVNHSCDPNLRYDAAGNVVAARDIRKGEEVFIDYGCFIVNFDEPFNCSCGAANCRGRIRRQDWKKLAVTYGMNMPRFLHSRIARALKAEREDRRYRRGRTPEFVGESNPSAA